MINRGIEIGVVADLGRDQQLNLVNCSKQALVERTVRGQPAPFGEDGGEPLAQCPARLHRLSHQSIEPRQVARRRDPLGGFKATDLESGHQIEDAVTDPNADPGRSEVVARNKPKGRFCSGKSAPAALAEGSQLRRAGA